MYDSVDQVEVLVGRVSELDGLTILQDPPVPVSLSDGTRSRDNSPPEPPLVLISIESQVCSITIRTPSPPLANVLQLPRPVVLSVI